MLEAADGVVAPEIYRRIAFVADCEPDMFGAGGIKCVFGLHREPIRRGSPFGCGRIGCRVGVEPVEPDQGAVVHAAAEAGFHRRVGTDHVYVYDPVRFVDRRCVDGVCDRIGSLVVCRPLPDAVL